MNKKISMNWLNNLRFSNHKDIGTFLYFIFFVALLLIWDSIALSIIIWLDYSNLKNSFSMRISQFWIFIMFVTVFTVVMIFFYLIIPLIIETSNNYFIQSTLNNSLIILVCLNWYFWGKNRLQFGKRKFAANFQDDSLETYITKNYSRKEYVSLRQSFSALKNFDLKWKSSMVFFLIYNTYIPFHWVEETPDVPTIISLHFFFIWFSLFIVCYCIYRFWKRDPILRKLLIKQYNDLLIRNHSCLNLLNILEYKFGHGERSLLSWITARRESCKKYQILHKERLEYHNKQLNLSIEISIWKFLSEWCENKFHYKIKYIILYFWMQHIY